jgi:hypothetical protein
MFYVCITVKELKMYYQNVRGLRSKTHEFLNEINCSNYEVIILTETWLNDGILNEELFDDRYVVYRRDRSSTGFHGNKDGGGVLIAILKSIHSVRNFEFDSICEDIWVTLDLKIENSIKKLHLCGVYLPPPISKLMLEHFIENCSNVINRYNSNDYICLVGDFNLGAIDWSLVNDSASNYVPPSLSQPLMDFIHLNNLNQLNRIVNKSNRVLDLMLADFSPSACSITESTHILSKVDHLHPPLDITVNVFPDLTLPYNSNTKIYNFKRADYSHIRKFLGEYNWELIFSDKGDVNEMTNMIYEILYQLIDKYVPKKKPASDASPPWFNFSLKRMLREKEIVRRRYKKYKNPLDEIELKLLSKRCSLYAKECYKKYIDGTEDSIKYNPKLFWSFIKTKKRGKSNYPHKMTNGNEIFSNGEDICNLFASHFKTVYNGVNLGDGQVLDCDLKMLNNHSLELTAPYLSLETILNSLKSLDPNKGAGPDGVPALFIQACAEELALPMYLIYNKSLQLGTFPEVWKSAKVVPIHKAEKVDVVNNYRPVSILSTLAKNFESLICPVIQNHLNHYLMDCQHGFVKFKSTCTNLTLFIETIVEALDGGKEVDVIYTDLSKAFDRVPHNILLTKLAAYGIFGSLLSWLRSYLHNRSFYVVVNGFKSNPCNITSGVPQGSHLGPLLFNAFINDITCCFLHATPFMYADDLKLVKVCETEDHIEQLQGDINRMEKWCQRNSMELNVKKCYHMTFSRKVNTLHTAYNINGSPIVKTDEIRDLGVILDRKLTFVPHIESISKKAHRMLGFVIRNTKVFKNNETKILLYNSLVRSILEYCTVVRRPHFATHTLRLERLQKRFVSNLAYRNGIHKKIRSYEKRMHYFKIISLENRRNLLDLFFCFQNLSP